MPDALDELFAGLGPTLEASEVAALLGMTKQGVYNWLRDGVIPGYKLGSSWFILRDDLKATMRRGSNRPPGAPAARGPVKDGDEGD